MTTSPSSRLIVLTPAFAVVALLLCLALAACQSASNTKSAATYPVSSPGAPTTGAAGTTVSGGATARQAAFPSADAAWKAADRIHTEDAYQSFMKHHPGDPHAAQAKVDAGKLAWLHAQNADTSGEYQAFADNYPDDPHTSKAREMAQGQEISLAAAINRGWVNAQVSGDDLQNVSLTVKRTVHRPLRVTVPAGTYFVSGGDAQNMVACADNTVDLTSDTSANLTVAAACANFHQDQPDSSNSFSVQESHPNPKLRKVLAVIAQEGPDSTASQLAIWSITDNPSRDDVSEHITPSPQSDDYQRAAKLLRDAGIKPSSRAMFQNLD